MKNQFLTFLDPYLSYIDSGDFYRKSFSWLYTFFAVVNLILPFYFLMITKNLIKFETILVLLVFFLVSWFSFMIWWNRKSKLEILIIQDDDFFAIPFFSHFIQTFGEWIGTWIGIVGFFMSIILRDSVYLFRRLNLDFLETSNIFGALLMLIYGFLIIIISRFISEYYRALCSIANNTKKN